MPISRRPSAISNGKISDISKVISITLICFMIPKMGVGDYLRSGLEATRFTNFSFYEN